MFSNILKNNSLSKDHIKILESKVYIKPVEFYNQFLIEFCQYLPNLLKGYDTIKVRNLLEREKENMSKYVFINGDESSIELFI